MSKTSMPMMAKTSEIAPAVHANRRLTADLRSVPTASQPDVGRLSRALALPLVLVALSVGTCVTAQTLRSAPSLGSAAPAKGAVVGAKAADFIVAVVDSEPITNSEIKVRLLRLEQQLSREGGALPPREQMAKQVLERLINERAQLQMARDTGMKVEESALDAAVATVARQNQLTNADFRTRVESEGVSWATFRADMRDEILLTRLRERDVEGRVRVAEADIDDYIRTNSDMSDPNQTVLNLAQILIPLPDGPSAAEVAAARARAVRARERAAATGADFAALASELSSGPEKGAGGELGARETSRYPELFVSATQSLKTGGISQVVQSGAGFHILKVLEKRAIGMPNMTVNQTRARHILLRTGPQVSASAATARLAEMRKRILNGETSFATLAKENSQDGSAAQGGDLGWTSPGGFVPEFEDVMNQLAPGQIGEPVVSRFGVHLIQVIERRVQELGEKEQREMVRVAVRNKKVDEQYITWAQEVRGKAYVEYRDALQVQ